MTNIKKYIPYIIAILIIAAALIVVIPKYLSEMHCSIYGERGEFTVKENGLSVFFVDVGQGDSTVIITPDGKSMIIDAGPEDCGGRLCSFVKTLGIEKADAMVITHPHNDHSGSADTFIKEFGADTLYIPPLSYSGSEYESALRAAYEYGSDVKTVRACESYTLGDEVSFEILSPMREVYDSENDECLIIRMQYGKTVFLFTADAEQTALLDLVKVYGKEKLRSNVFKAAHHGSAGSACEELMKAVSPEISVISCGYGNEYGHPQAAALDLLDKYSKAVFRTDLCGTVYAFSNGETVSVTTSK